MNAVVILKDAVLEAAARLQTELLVDGWPLYMTLLDKVNEHLVKQNLFVVCDKYREDAHILDIIYLDGHIHARQVLANHIADAVIDHFDNTRDTYIKLRDGYMMPEDLAYHVQNPLDLADDELVDSVNNVLAQYIPRLRIETDDKVTTQLSLNYKIRFA